jgi:hypothetical protein
MRIVMGSLIVLTMAAHPALGDEAFIAQVTGKTAAIEQTALASVKTALSAARLAIPVQPSLISPPAQISAAPGTNISSVTQSGTNNFAAVSQMGGGNASAIVQKGTGNQAIVTQRH